MSETRISRNQPSRIARPHHTVKGMPACVYILASRPNGTLYVGVTSHLIQRVHQHRIGTFAGFTQTHGVKMLVWYECGESIAEAIRREKQIKAWKRDWKLRLIAQRNPTWRDLWEELLG